jgi:tRNA G18 (ribose-2'-O)-methylase SpoU
MTGYFGVAVWHPKTEANIGTLWRHASLYGAAFVGTVGRRYVQQASDTTKVDRRIPLIHYADIDDLVRHMPRGCPIIGVELDPRAKLLDESFNHDDRALYLLGAEDHGLPPDVLDRCHRIVQIPSPQPWSMNVAVAGTLVMHDRYAKSLQRQRVAA